MGLREAHEELVRTQEARRARERRYGVSLGSLRDPEVAAARQRFQAELEETLDAIPVEQIELYLAQRSDKARRALASLRGLRLC